MSQVLSPCETRWCHSPRVTEVAGRVLTEVLHWIMHDVDRAYRYVRGRLRHVTNGEGRYVHADSSAINSKSPSTQGPRPVSYAPDVKSACIVRHLECGLDR